MIDASEKPDLLLFFDTCSKIEGLCAELYHYYSELFLENEEVSHLWKKTALDEENHQKMIEFANRLRNDCEFELIADIEKPYRVYNKLSLFVSHVRQFPPEIVPALTNAIEMEEALCDLHIGSSVKVKDPQLKIMFKGIGDEEREHIKALRNFLTVMMLPLSEMTESD
jgi:rubrerythrin